MNTIHELNRTFHHLWLHKEIFMWESWYTQEKLRIICKYIMKSTVVLTESIDWLIDWCLTPTYTVFQLYPRVTWKEIRTHLAVSDKIDWLIIA